MISRFHTSRSRCIWSALDPTVAKPDGQWYLCGCRQGRQVSKDFVVLVAIQTWALQKWSWIYLLASKSCNEKTPIYESLFQEWWIWIWELFVLGLLTARRLSRWKTAFGCFLGESFPDVAHQKDHATDATATLKNLYRRGKSQLSRVSPRVDDSHGHLGASVQVQLVGHDWSVSCHVYANNSLKFVSWWDLGGSHIPNPATNPIPSLS